MQTTGPGPHQARPLQAEQTAEEDHQTAARVPGGVGEGQRRHQRGGGEDEAAGGAGAHQHWSQ